jgi:hypothetical protein
MTPKSSCNSSKHSNMMTPKKYGKEKLTKFRTGKQIDFKELYDKINSIGS